MSELIFRTDETATNMPSTLSVYVAMDSVVYAAAREPSQRRVPFAIPRDQAYYWSSDWQADIRAAHDALAAGDYVEFDSDDPNDIVRWFLSDDD